PSPPRGCLDGPEGDARPTRSRFRVPLRDLETGELARELLLGDRLAPPPAREFGVRLVQGASADFAIRRQETVLRHPGPEVVFVGAVLARRTGHGFGLRQPATLPVKATAHGPGEDAGALGRQLLLEVRILLLCGDGHGPRNELDAAPRRVVVRPDRGPLVGGKN